MKRVLFFIVVCISGSIAARAGGFEQPNQSAGAAGVANAVVASIDSPAALAFNPSGIAWSSRGVHIEGGIYFDYRDSSVKLAGGIAPNEGVESLAGSFFVTWVPKGSRISSGIGIAPLYHVVNDWTKAFPGAAGVSGTSGVVDLTVHHLTGDVVYAASSDLSIGLGADWYITRATLNQGAASSFVQNNYTGFGGHVSVMWKPLPAWSLGAMIRSGATIKLSGDLNDNMSIKLPDQFSVGISHDFADAWRLETDVKWTRWSTLTDLNVTKAGVISQLNALDLSDTVTIMTGLTWIWGENSQIRAGYAYDQAANRNATFNPAIADQNGHRISLGLGGDMFNAHVDVTYQYEFFSKKTVKGAYSGTYRDRKQTLMLSISKSFE